MGECPLNYRNRVSIYLNDVEHNLVINAEDNEITSYDYACASKALRLVREYFDKYFEISLKLYGLDEELAYDVSEFESALVDLGDYIIPMLGKRDSVFENFDKRVLKEVKILSNKLQML